ncbi:hypothetical protein [Methylobacterium hispanicum]|uniref:hypothetical protein n=1 Tax=Methylobacterium hispanicum TaxID=270350 RepID=UPI002F30E07F
MSEEQHKAPPAGLRGTTDHVDAGDGWLIVRLLTRQAMDREGAHMGHCLGDGSYDELAGDEELTSNAIWSLRDPDGVSWATLDVHWHTVVMAKGPGNRTVRKGAARRLSALVAAFRATGRDLGFAGETDLLVTAEGQVMREDQAPAAIRAEVRARHRAVMEARPGRPLRTHEIEVTSPEMPGVRWVLTACYGQSASERAGG